MEYRFTSIEKHFAVLFMLFATQKDEYMTEKKKNSTVSTEEMIKSLASIIKNGMKLDKSSYEVLLRYVLLDVVAA